MADPPERGPVKVVVRVATDPDGAARVLLQLPHGYVLLWPEDAREVARWLVEASGELS